MGMESVKAGSQGQQEEEDLEFDQEIAAKNVRKLVKTQSLIRIFFFNVL
jgi:hypothetical protein